MSQQKQLKTYYPAASANVRFRIFRSEAGNSASQPTGEKFFSAGKSFAIGKNDVKCTIAS